MRKVLLGLGLVVVGGLAASRYLTTDPSAFPPDDGPANPLPPCPGTPNCVRTTWLFDETPAILFDRARSALEATGAATVSVSPGASRLDAVYRAFVFEDDVAIVTEAYRDGAALHLRSASRIGRSDVGVNERRVRAIAEALGRRAHSRQP